MYKIGAINELLTTYEVQGKYSQVFILVDENTKKYCLPLIQLDAYKTIEIKSGEQQKNIETCQFIWQTLINHQADRKALLINLGGGVITDMGAFAASCFKRGIDYLNVPTTLLAMVDAAVGGKTGVNFGHIKNSIGLFNHHAISLIDSQFLHTLSNRHLINGKAEMLKHGLIADKNHWLAVQQSTISDALLIEQSIKIKEKIVLEDPYEKGIRKVLNFGHTIGHAIESFALDNKLDILHGEAVLLGMYYESKLSSKLNILDKESADTIQKQILAIITKPNWIAEKELIGYMLNDKKNESEQIQFTLLKAIGKAVFNQIVPNRLIKEVLHS